MREIYEIMNKLSFVGTICNTLTFIFIMWTVFAYAKLFMERGRDAFKASLFGDGFSTTTLVIYVIILAMLIIATGFKINYKTESYFKLLDYVNKNNISISYEINDIGNKKEVLDKLRKDNEDNEEYIEFIKFLLKDDYLDNEGIEIIQAVGKEVGNKQFEEEI